MQTGDLQRAGVGVQHGAGQDRPAESDAHQHLDRFQVIGRQPDPQWRSGLLQGVPNDPMRVGMFVRQNRRVACQLLEGHALAIRQRMGATNDDVQRIGPDQTGGESGVRLRRQRDHGHFQLAGQHCLAGQFGIHEVDVQIDVRIRLGEGAQHRWQPVQADVMAGADGQAATDELMQLGQAAAGIVQAQQHLFGIGQQGGPGLGEHDLATDPVQQLVPDFLFQRGDSLADGRLGDVQHLGTAGEGAAAGHLDKSSERLGIHGVGSARPDAHGAAGGGQKDSIK